MGIEIGNCLHIEHIDMLFGLVGGGKAENGSTRPCSLRGETCFGFALPCQL